MKLPTIYHDFETKSFANLTKTGVDAYAEHPSTGILTLSYALDDGPVREWIIGQPDPQELLEAIERGAPLSAWNYSFESAMWHYVVRRIKPHWPQPRPEQGFCTMVRAQALAFPAGLDKAAEALGLDTRKDRAGQRLMLRMCQPCRAWKEAAKAGVPIEERPNPWAHETPENLRALSAYCRQDVEVEREIGRRVAPLEERERKLYLLDQRINRRGVRLDIPNIKAALTLVEGETKVMNRELRQVTGGAVPAVSNPGKLLAWANERMKAEHEARRINEPFVPLVDMKKRTVNVAIADNILIRKDPQTDEIILPDVRRALEIRRDAGKASVKKLGAMLECASRDGRARGLFRYHAATTGRWSASRVQPHNMFRPALSKKEIEQVIALLSEFPDPTHAAAAIRFGYAPPIEGIASCMRGMIQASPGRKFVGGDLANIEGRMHAWLAGEEWKLQAFREYDMILGADAKGKLIRKGPDLYRLAYARSFGVPVETVNDDQRQAGKVQELSLQFLGGPFALLGMCLLLGQDPAKLAAAIHAITDGETWEYWFKRQPKDLRGITAHTWVGLRVAVQAWRDAHPATKAYWYDLGDRAIDAIEKPGQVFATETKRIKFIRHGDFLYLQLPSRRCLAYARPEIVWVAQDGKEVDARLARELIDKEGRRAAKKQIMFWGVGKKSKRWERRKLSLPLLAENPTQAAARDVLCGGMLRAEAAHYPIVLHVHDAALAEVPEQFGGAEEFNRLLCDVEPCYAGLPVSAETYEATRFQK